MKLEPLKISQYYHFFNRGNNSENIFREEDNYFHFLNLIKKYILPIADIYSYCLLPNHFHLIIRIKDKADLPNKFQEKNTKIFLPFSNLFNAYAKGFNKKYSRKGSLFQKNPKRILIKDENYLKNLIIYVNINPFHHNISDYKHYIFSSFKALTSTKPTLIKRNEVITLFETPENLNYVLSQKKVNIDLIKEMVFE